MTRLEAIDALLTKVKAGEMTGSDLSLVATIGLSGQSAQFIGKAYHGSTDAALALIGAVLPGWVIHKIQWKWGDLVEADIWEVNPEGWHTEGLRKVVGRSSTPARALLIATLEAMRVKEEADAA